MQIPQLLDALAFAVHIEIVITPLPESITGRMLNLARHQLLQHLQGDGKSAPFGLADEEVNMLRHRHISDDHDSIPLPHVLELKLKDPARSRLSQIRLPPIATEGNEMELPGALKSLE
jgi:hypothetical protein